MAEAEAPFNYSARADVILRSSDQIEFYATKAFLSYASPVFVKILDQDTKSVRNINGRKLPIIDMPEESKFVRYILLFCYPGGPPVFDVSDTIPMACISTKYHMEGIKGLLRSKIHASDAIQENPLGIFAIAYHLGWEDVGRRAAKETLAKQLALLPFSADLKYLTGIEMHCLEDYRYRATESLFKWIQQNIDTPGQGIISIKSIVTHNKLGINANQSYSFIWQRAHKHDRECKEEGIKFMSLTSSGSITTPRFWSPPTWWATYFQAIVARLDLYPSGSTVRETELYEAAVVAGSTSNCKECRRAAALDMEKFRTLFADKVDEVVSKVPLNIDFNHGGTRKTSTNTPDGSGDESESAEANDKN